MNRQTKAIKKAEKKQNEKVARFMLSEVAFEPGVTNTERIFDCLFMFFAPLITYLCVIWASLKCCELEYNVALYVAAVFVIQVILFGTIYNGAIKGKWKWLLGELIALSLLIYYVADYIKEGLLSVVDAFIGLLNSYARESYEVTENFYLEQSTSIFVFLFILAIIDLFVLNYVFTCYTSKTLFFVVTLPLIILPFIVGLTPETFPFVIYVGIALALMSTRSFKKKRSDGKLARKKMFLKSFVDAPVVRAMCCTFVGYIVIAAVVYLILPDQYGDKDFMRERHIAFENSQNEKIDEADNKYGDSFGFIDRLLNADSMKIGEAKDDKNGPQSQGDGINYKLDYKNLIDSLKGNVDRQELVEKLAQKAVGGAQGFYNSYMHGDLNYFKGKENINTGKLYNLYIEDINSECSSQYITNYIAEEYKDGMWKSYTASKRPDIVQQMDNLYYENINIYGIGSYDYEGNFAIKDRKMILSAQAGYVDDSVYNYFYPEAEPLMKDGKISYEYTVSCGEDINYIEAPYGIANYLGTNIYLTTMENANRDKDKLMMEPFEIGGYDNLYQLYTNMPDTESMTTFKKDVQEDYKEYPRRWPLEYEQENEYYIDIDIEPYKLYGGYDSGRDLFADNSDEAAIAYNNYVITALEYIVSELEMDYNYTLEPKRTQGEDPVIDFYYNTHEGYCMHFASTAVMMLRSLGIPARYVEGYMVYENSLLAELAKTDEGEYAEVGIYGTDAHAWIQVYIKGLGWVNQEMTLGSTAEGRIFYDETLNYRKEKNPGGKNIVEEKPTQKPTQKPDEKPTDKPEETVNPTQTPDDKTDDGDKNSENEQTDGHEQSPVKSIPKSVWIVSIVVVIIGMILIFILTKKKKRADYAKNLKLTKKAYRHVSKFMVKSAKKNDVVWSEDKDYMDFAKEFSEADKNIDYYDAVRFVEIARRSVYSEDGIVQEDVEQLRQIYNRYMDNASKEWGKLRRFINIKIKGVVMKL